MKELSDYNIDTAALLQDLFDEAYDLIQIVKIDGRVLFVNNAWARLLGYCFDEIIDKSIYSFIAEEDRERYEHYRRDIIEGLNRGSTIIFKLLKKNGELMSVEGALSVKQLNGQPLYTRGIFRDITIRLNNEIGLKLLHEELNEREQNLNSLLMHAPDAVIVIDEEGNISFWNPKAEALFGWKVQEVLKHKLSDFIIPQQYREAHQAGMIRFLKTGEARVLNRTIEITALKKSGEEFYVALTISATQQGGHPAFIAFLRDVSQQRQNQIELETRTLQLERSNAYLEDFAHVASHDLKEPLRKILVFGARLKQNLQEYATQLDNQYFERLERSAQRMQLLVDDLLEFSQVSSNEPEHETVDLNEKVKKILQDLELLIEEKNAQIKMTNLPEVKGNRRQLQQLLSNLISNSLKYSKPNLPPVLEFAYSVVKGTDLVDVELNAQGETRFHLIELHDNGIGFEQTYANRIFEVFRRLHGKEEYSGSGVGLAIARKVVTNHKGYIWATGRPGQGASFYIALPVEGG